MPAHDELHARLFLLHAAEPPAPAIHHYVAVHGPVDAVAQIRHGTAPAAVLSEIRRPDARIEEDLRALDSGTARLLTPEDGDWPLGRLTGLASLGVPLALWVRGSGSLAELTSLAVSLVGARAATNYGDHVAAEFGHGLAARGWTVISGAAYGIDGAAHRGALAAEGRTLAVLGCGIDIRYPAGHAALLDRIAEDGLVLSEYAPGTTPARHRSTRAAGCWLLSPRRPSSSRQGSAAVPSPSPVPLASSAAGSTACLARSTPPRRRA